MVLRLILCCLAVSLGASESATRVLPTEVADLVESRDQSLLLAGELLEVGREAHLIRALAGRIPITSIQLEGSTCAVRNGAVFSFDRYGTRWVMKSSGTRSEVDLALTRLRQRFALTGSSTTAVLQNARVHLDLINHHLGPASDLPESRLSPVPTLTIPADISQDQWTLEAFLIPSVDPPPLPRDGSLGTINDLAKCLTNEGGLRWNGVAPGQTMDTRSLPALICFAHPERILLSDTRFYARTPEQPGEQGRDYLRIQTPLRNGNFHSLEFYLHTDNDDRLRLFAQDLAERFGLTALLDDPVAKDPSAETVIGTTRLRVRITHPACKYRHGAFITIRNER